MLLKSDYNNKQCSLLKDIRIPKARTLSEAGGGKAPLLPSSQRIILHSFRPETLLLNRISPPLSSQTILEAHSDKILGVATRNSLAHLVSLEASQVTKTLSLPLAKATEEVIPEGKTYFLNRTIIQARVHFFPANVDEAEGHLQQDQPIGISQDGVLGLIPRVFSSPLVGEVSDLISKASFI